MEYIIIFHQFFQILRLAGQGAGMGMDWIGEMVVWGEKNGQSSPAAIKTYDIAGGQTRVKMPSVTVPGKVKKFLLSPMTRCDDYGQLCTVSYNNYDPPSSKPLYSW